MFDILHSGEIETATITTPSMAALVHMSNCIGGEVTTISELNRQELGSQRQPEADEPFFGTRIREAIDIFRHWK
jgi:hypothetical protein